MFAFAKTLREKSFAKFGKKNQPFHSVEKHVVIVRLNGKVSCYEDCLAACKTISQRIELASVFNGAPGPDSQAILRQIGISYICRTISVVEDDEHGASHS